jgi:hypothetical protein
MYVYIYENHLGGSNYVSTKEISDKDLYCETCGDCDWLVDRGEAEDLLECERLKVKNAIADYRAMQKLLMPYVDGENNG